MTTLTRRQLLTRIGVVAGGAILAPTIIITILDETAGAASLPDLVVTAITGLTGITTGQVVVFGAAVKNQGPGATPTGIMDAVAFLVDGKEIGWSGKFTTSLAPGASVTLLSDSGGVTRNGTWTATEGTHTIMAWVNDVHRFAEVSATNNTMSATFTVVAAQTKPVSSALPVITGTARVGSMLSASQGTWT